MLVNMCVVMCVLCVSARVAMMEGLSALPEAETQILLGDMLRVSSWLKKGVPG